MHCMFTETIARWPNMNHIHLRGVVAVDEHEGYEAVHDVTDG